MLNMHSISFYLNDSSNLVCRESSHFRSTKIMIPDLGYPFVELKCRRHVTSYLYADWLEH
jgi:hypothetical protein